MIKIKSKYVCCGCHGCYQVCPVDAITMTSDDEGFLYPEVDGQKCIHCGKCEQVCPEIVPYSIFPAIKTYAAYRSDFVKRLQSASGGIFAVLAEYVLRNNGVVFGAAFDEQWSLRHCAVHALEDLPNLLGSKYVQSTIGYTFRDAAQYLKRGKLVLFSGTPCQIQGLKKYLGNDHPKLITIDLICHGVPSPQVWKKYLTEISDGRRLIQFRPRDKRDGLKNAPLIFGFDNGDIIEEKYSKNQYIKGFIQNLYLRPSCHKCKFKGAERCSDFTLGDFWGVENVKPDFSDEYGTSAVMLHTLKAQKLFLLVKDKLIITPSATEQVGAENPCLSFSVNENSDREKFFQLQKKIGVIKAVKQLTRPTFKERLTQGKNQLITRLWVIKKKIWK